MPGSRNYPSADNDSSLPSPLLSKENPEDYRDQWPEDGGLLLLAAEQAESGIPTRILHAAMP